MARVVERDQGDPFTTIHRNALEQHEIPNCDLREVFSQLPARTQIALPGDRFAEPVLRGRAFRSPQHDPARRSLR